MTRSASTASTVLQLTAGVFAICVGIFYPISQNAVSVESLLPAWGMGVLLGIAVGLLPGAWPIPVVLLVALLGPRVAEALADDPGYASPVLWFTLGFGLLLLAGRSWRATGQA